MNMPAASANPAPISESRLRIAPLLQVMVKQNASDLYLTTGAHASIKVRGKLRRISREPMKPGNIMQLITEIISDTKMEAFLPALFMRQKFLQVLNVFMNFY